MILKYFSVGKGGGRGVVGNNLSNMPCLTRQSIVDSTFRKEYGGRGGH